MRCPKDANTHMNSEDNTQYCLAHNLHSNTTWTCTRKKGHRGLHHAHGIFDKCLDTWETTFMIFDELVDDEYDA